MGIILGIAILIALLMYVYFDKGSSEPHESVYVNGALIFKARTPIGKVVGVIAAHLEKKGAEFSYIDSTQTFIVPFDDPRSNSKLTVFISIEGGTNQIRLGMLIKTCIQDNVLQKVAELVARLNALPKKGFFHLDYEHRRVSFEMCLYPMGQPLTDELLASSIKTVLAMYMLSEKSVNAVVDEEQDPILVYYSLLKEEI